MSLLPGASSQGLEREVPRGGQAVERLPGPLTVQLPSARLLRWLSLTALTLLLFSAAGRIAEAVAPDFFGRDLFVGLFAVNSEANLPTTFSGIILTIAAGLLFVIAGAKRAVRDAYWRMWSAMSWLFVYLTVDELAQVHDRATLGVRKMLGEYPAFLHYTWILPYAVLVVGVAVVSIPFLRHLPARTRGGLLLSGAMYVTGGLVLESAEGVLEVTGRFYSAAMPVLIHLEEGLEMYAVILLIATLLHYRRTHLPGLKILGDIT